MNEKKLSKVMIEMAKQLLKQTQEIPASEPFHVALLLAAVAWNREVVGDDFQSNDQYYVHGCSVRGICKSILFKHTKIAVYLQKLMLFP